MSLSAQDRMVSGDWYNCLEDDFEALRRQARRAVHAHTMTPPDERGDCAAPLRALFAGFGEACFIEAPFHCSYGINIRLADRVYVNAGAVILDSGPVSIGTGTMLGPGVHIYCADHHPDADLRGQGIERALPVIIGRDVWIGGAAVLLPGVTVGDGAIIGAGAVVRGNVASGMRVAGVPARAI